MNAIQEINAIVKKAKGRKMNAEELALQEKLRHLVKTKKITVEEGHKMWDKVVK